MFWHTHNKGKIPVKILETHDHDYLVENIKTHSRYRVKKEFIHDDILTPESSAIKCDAAIGMLVTDDEMMARRALTFLNQRGRFSFKDLGWFYKEGHYTVVIIGTPEQFGADEEHFHRLKQSIDTICHTDLLASAQLSLNVFQEVSL